MDAPRDGQSRIDRDLVLGVGKKAAVFLATRRLLKAVPILGVGIAAYAGYANVRRKGWVRGGVDTALDLTPVVGRVKALYEFFRGDLIVPRDPGLVAPEPDGE
jgi:hypothetical protein